MLGFIYGVANPGVGGDSAVVVVSVWAAAGVLHFLTGFGVGRVWVIALPVLAVLLAIPAGEAAPSNPQGGVPLWFGLLVIWAPAGVVLMAVGVVARGLAERGGSRGRRRRTVQAGPAA